MKKNLSALIVVGILAAACTKMEQYYPNGQVVLVDGIEFSVSPMGSRPSTYRAMPNNPRDQNFLTIDPMTWVQNVKAIEQATGCPVLRESIKNGDSYTFAVVDCA